MSLSIGDTFPEALENNEEMMPDTRPPLVEPLARLSPVDVFVCLAKLPHVVYFDSAMVDENLGRYSFVAADPWAWIERPVRDGCDWLTELAGLLDKYYVEPAPGLPPYQGGAAGLFGYELARGVERIPAARYDEFQIPALAVGLYDVVIAFDHATDEAWIISQGLPERDRAACRDRASSRLREFLTLLKGGEGSANVSAGLRQSLTTSGPLTAEQLCPQFVTGHVPGMTSDFSREGYLRAVDRAIESIHAGDIFQVNLSQRILHPADDDAVALYLRLRERNAAPFAGFLNAGTFQVISASPERFLRVEEGQVETRPIKGTRPRMRQPEADLYAGDELRQSEKDRAENIMIVDLLRNDLSRVCESDSVQVHQLCGLETYAYVQHLVSTVRGQLRTDCTPLDLLKASFPGGSITGAPKIRAMEIISEMEPTARGAYCGSLGYIGLNGAMDTNILIRTITAARQWWQLPVGGGIVAQSDPRLEYEETWHKAEGMLRALKRVES